ncbi:MAG: radical SAM protein, partial [Eubacteriales bacterium]
LKDKYPDCIILFGGHNVPNDFSILVDLGFVDVLFHGESEEPFLSLLKALALGKSLETVSNISFRKAKGNFFRTETVYYDSVESYPSPYLLGLFDKYLTECDPDDFCYIIETNRGCPYHCAYCDWCFSTKLKLFPMERIKKEIEWFAVQKAEYIFCADANFGILERDLEIAQWVVDVKKRTGYPLVFNGCYAKNSDDIVFEISKLLFDNKANKAATLAYQSLNVIALENVNRKNFTMESFSKLLQRYNEAGIPTYTEMILGLPGETYESFCQGLCELIEAGQHGNSTVYACQVYCNSFLGQKDYQKKYGIDVAHMPINYIRFLPPQKDEIQEYMDLIVATNTMSREMMASAMIFCTCLQCFHHIGLLRCFAVYLRHEKNVSYLDFYHRLLDYIFSANGTLMNDVFIRLGDMCNDCTTGEWTYCDERFGDTGWFLEEGAFLELIYDHKRFWEEIKPFLDSFEIDKDVYKELLNYQQSIIRMPNQKTLELNLSYDYYNYFLDIFTNKYEPLKKIKNKLTMEVDIGVANWKDYAKLVMLYAKRRGDTVITNAKKNVRLDYIK